MSRLSLETCTSNLKSVSLTILELLAFDAHFKLVRLTGPLRTHIQKYRHIDRTTSNQNIISAIQFVHLAEINIKCTLICTFTTYQCCSKSQSKFCGKRHRYELWKTGHLCNTMLLGTTRVSLPLPMSFVQQL